MPELSPPTIDRERITLTKPAMVRLQTDRDILNRNRLVRGIRKPNLQPLTVRHGSHVKMLQGNLERISLEQ